MGKPKQPKRCRWCNRETSRHCGICLACCDKRDEKNRQISAGLIPYVPPELRPGHRLFADPAKRAARIVAAAKGKATKLANLPCGNRLESNATGKVRG